MLALILFCVLASVESTGIMSQVIIDLIETSAARWGVPADLAIAVANRESGLDQSARGAAGEIGVFQLMPAAAAEVGVDRLDLQGNIEGGVQYLRRQFDRFGNWATALAAYNAGPGNVSRGIIPDSTQQYVADVLGASERLPTPVPGLVLDFGGVEHIGSALPFWLGLAAAGLATLIFLRR